jgi:hypothetical protein
MKRIIVFCEGQTEETFVREVLKDNFDPQKFSFTPILFNTSKNYKGGVFSYAKIKWQIENKCKEDQSAYITTLIDLYGLPKDFPRKKELSCLSDLYKKVDELEKAFSDDINKSNFIPNLALHEFEGLLFSDVSKFESWFDFETVQALENEASGFDSPEHINDNIETAPSKRILRTCNEYDKILHGSALAIDIGLSAIRSQCSHFNSWLSKIESL